MPRVRGLTLAALLLAFCPTTLFAETPTADLHPYIPGDAKLVALVRAQLLLDAPLVDRDNPYKLRSIWKEEFKDPTILGVKPLKDITSALIALPSVGDVPKMFVVMKGAFDPAVIRASVARQFKDRVKEHGEGAKAFQEFPLDELNFQGVTTPTVAFLAVPDRNTCLLSLGSKADIVAALSDKKAGTPAPLRDLIDKSDKEQVASYALVNHGGGPLAELKGVRRAFKLFQTAQGGVRIDEEASGFLIVTSPNAEACEEMTDLVRAGVNAVTGGVALLTMGNKDLKPVLDVLRTIRVSNKDAKITVRGKLERDVLEEMIKPNK
jgi:hypothetical protein